ncbi:MAG: hypothetical protein IJ837_02645 [Clostridia bacterium]|nr:hypothetical protein [Clostridia bacterium]
MSKAIKQLTQKFLKNSDEQTEKFVYATDWFESTKNLKTYDELILSLVDYCSYVDKQKLKVKVYFAQKNDKEQSKPALYSNFPIDKSEKETVAKMDGEKYAAYTYSKHYNSIMSKKETASLCENKKPEASEFFDSKK